MAKGKRYNLPFRRQREGRTNYKARLRLLESQLPRVVARRSNKHILLQVATYTPHGDKVLVSAHSHELAGFGWKAGCHSMPAAYLTGLLLGTRITKAHLGRVIADFGLQRAQHFGVLMATVKGIIDAGVSLPAREEYFPPESRLKGEHIEAYAKKQTSHNQFATTKEAAMSITHHFSTVRNAILGKEHNHHPTPPKAPRASSAATSSSPSPHPESHARSNHAKSD